MADSLRELIDIPGDFLKEGTQVSPSGQLVKPSLITLTYRRSSSPHSAVHEALHQAKPKGCVSFEVDFMASATWAQQWLTSRCPPPLSRSLAPTEYLQICRAVGMGFVVMGFIGYFVKLIHIPINNIVSRLLLLLALTRLGTADALSPRSSCTCSTAGSHNIRFGRATTDILSSSHSGGA